MRADLHAGIANGSELICSQERWLADVSRDDEERAYHVVSLQDRQCMEKGIIAAIIKRENDGLLGERTARCKLLKGNRIETIIPQRI
jgi:hypothetical protein